MEFWQNIEQRARRFSLWDFKLSQAAAMLLALIIVKLIPQILTIHIGWFIALAIVCAIKPVLVFLR